MIHDFGIPIKRHGENFAIFDVIGLASGDIAFDNLSIIEAQIERGHEKAHQLGEMRGWLHAYMGIKARVYAIEADLKEKYSNHVAKSEDETLLAADEFRYLATARDNYNATFSRWGVDEWAQNEYDTFIKSLNEVFETRGKKLISDFEKYEELHNER